MSFLNIAPTLSLGRPIPGVGEFRTSFRRHLGTSLMYLVVFEATLLGSGQMIHMGGITLKMILFSLSVLYVMVSLLCGDRVTRSSVLLLSYLFISIGIASFIGLLSAAPFSRIGEDISPFLYFLILPFFELTMQTKREETSTVSELASASSQVSSSRIFAVIVLYECLVSHSSTCTSLLNQCGSSGNRIACLAYDNSPEPALEAPPPGWTYFSDMDNGGLSKAYNHALSLAQEQGYDWLLLLDQDSVLPPNFLVTLFAAIDGVQDRSGIAAIVPRVFSGTRQVSPIRPHPGREVPIDRSNSVASGWVSAINSAACIRTDFVASIGGFANEFWLDYLDYWLFLKLYRCGKQVFISEARVQHELSVASFERSMNPVRFQNILAAEMRFTNDHLGPVWRVALAVRLLMRTAKHLILGHDTCFAQATFRAAHAQVLSIFLRLGA